MEKDLKFNVSGNNNKVILVKNGVEIPYKNLKGLSIEINGNDNTVIIELPSNFIATSIVILGDSNYLSIKSTKHRTIRHTTFGLDNGATIKIGSGLSVYRKLNIVSKNHKTIQIGDECMIAREVMIRNDDGHVILDKNTGEILNVPDDIFIGDKVWIGMRSIILKGSKISNGSVVGAMSLVNKSFDEENILIAGVPAKKIRDNITWERNNYAQYIKKNEP